MFVLYWCGTEFNVLRFEIYAFKYQWKRCNWEQILEVEWHFIILFFIWQTNSEGAEHCSIADESGDGDSTGGRRLSGSDNKDAETSAEDGRNLRWISSRTLQINYFYIRTTVSIIAIDNIRLTFTSSFLSDILDNLRVASPKPGHAERIHSPTPAVAQQKPVRTFDRFLKINVRHITDGQVRIILLLVDPFAEQRWMW